MNPEKNYIGSNCITKVVRTLTVYNLHSIDSCRRYNTFVTTVACEVNILCSIGISLRLVGQSITCYIF